MAKARWVRVWNETREEEVLARARWCRSFVCQLRGLTFRRELPPDEGLLLAGRRENRIDTAIHMFFVFFPIGVVWLDREGHVVDTCLAHPFRPIYIPGRPARDILEGPPDLLDGVSVGDRLRFDSL